MTITLLPTPPGIQDTNNRQTVPGMSSKSKGLCEIPDSVYEKALEKVQQFIGGVSPPSKIIEPTPPAITIEMLQRLKALH